MGLVSRVTPVHTAMRNSTRDEGGPFEVDNQVLISGHRKLLWSKAMVVSVAEKPKQNLITSGMDERDERKRTSVEASKCFQTTSKLGFHYYFRKSMAGTYQLAMRCPVYRRRDSHLGSRTELENLAGDAKGKSTSGEPARLKVPMRRRGADCPVLVMKRV